MFLLFQFVVCLIVVVSVSFNLICFICWKLHFMVCLVTLVFGLHLFLVWLDMIMLHWYSSSLSHS